MLSSLQVDIQKGLSEVSVLHRRIKHGWNEFVIDNTQPVWKKYLDQVKNRDASGKGFCGSLDSRVYVPCLFLQGYVG